MFQQDVVTVNTPEEFEQALARFLAEVEAASAAPEPGPFDTHAANLESLADDIDDGMNYIANNSEIPEDMVEGDVPASLIKAEMALADAGKLYALALRTQAADWRKANPA